MSVEKLSVKNELMEKMQNKDENGKWVFALLFTVPLYNTYQNILVKCDSFTNSEKRIKILLKSYDHLSKWIHE